MTPRGPIQGVRDFPGEEDVGSAERVLDRPARRLGLWVVDPDGNRVGEITDAATAFENQPRVVIGLDEGVRRELGLVTRAVDVESRRLARIDQDTVRLEAPLAEVLKQEGFDLG
ncbi:MAG TPA: hypothetical protein VM889_13855 [Candidatus Thermoplasmatota archaeon]|nr:hypothetical protein [Candidatus Thermoplasmatota archaeon]